MIYPSDERVKELIGTEESLLQHKKDAGWCPYEQEYIDDICALKELLSLREWNKRLNEYATPQSTSSDTIRDMVALLDEWVSVDDGSNKEFIGEIQDVLTQMILERKAHDTDVKTLLGLYKQNKILRKQRKQLIHAGNELSATLLLYGGNHGEIGSDVLEQYKSLLKELEK